jgi:hypothetical protein
MWFRVTFVTSTVRNYQKMYASNGQYLVYLLYIRRGYTTTDRISLFPETWKAGSYFSLPWW